MICSVYLSSSLQSLVVQRVPVTVQHRRTCQVSCQSAGQIQDSVSISRRDVLTVGASVASVAACGLIVRPLEAKATIVDEDNARVVFDAASASVVGIIDLKVVGNGEEVLEGVGSGVVWDKYGHIVTNYHCVQKLARDTTGKQVTRIELTGHHGDVVQFPATIIGTDPSNDLAVLQIDAAPEMLSPMQFAASNSLKVGQIAYAIGNPYGLSKTLTAGVISGLNRVIPAPNGSRILGVVQTDASINAGNSGGPLLDAGGRMVAMNTATFTRQGTGRSSGVNFAVGVDLLRDIVPNLIVYGNASAKGVGRR